jgi:hypothetical protein
MRSTNRVVQPFIGQHKAFLGLDRVEAAATMCPLLAPYLEQIGVIGFECEGESHWKFREAVIVDAEAFIAGSLPEEPHPAEVKRAAG